MISDRELVARRLDVLYVLDRNGCLLFDNEPFEPERCPAPLIHVSAGHNISVCGTRHDVPEPLSRELIDLAHRHADGQGKPSPALIHAIRTALEPSFTLDSLYAGPAYRFPPAIPTSLSAVVLDQSRSHALGSDFGDLAEQLAFAQPCTAALVADRAVAVCQTVRRSATMAEAGLDTLPAFRRQGHGSQAVLHWAHLIRASGIEPLYSASWDNTASCALARGLRLDQYGTDLSICGTMK